MNMRHKTVYDYAYKLYRNSCDCSANAFVKLPTGTTAERFVEMLTGQNLADVYKVSLLRTKTITDMRTTKVPVVYSNQKQIELFMDDAVHSGMDVRRNAASRYKETVCLMPYSVRPDTAPVVTTGNGIFRRNGVYWGGYVRTGRGDDNVEYRAPREESWNERVIFVQPLDSMHDLLVNKQIQQIWPKSTGTIPLRLKQFFQYAK